MIKHAWTVICQKSIIDQETNNVSLDVLEQLNIKTPVVPPKAKGIFFPMQIEIVSLWYRGFEEKGIEGKGQIRIETSNGNKIGSAGISINLTKSRRTRTRARLDGLPVPRVGSDYFYFIVEVESNSKWIEVARLPLEVNINTATNKKTGNI